MPLQSPKPLFTQRVSVAVPSVTSAATNTVYIPAPFAGRVLKVGVTIGAAVATADGTCTTNINGAANPITGGVITLTSAASAAGNSFSAVPTAANTVNEDDGIGFVFSGSATGGGVAAVWADIRRGPF
jgi:hypothetical protein